MRAVARQMTFSRWAGMSLMYAAGGHDVGVTDDEVTTDEDQSLVADGRAQPEWRQYELDVKASLEDLDRHADIRHDVKVLGELSNSQRQIDVLAEREIVGKLHRVVVECKHYRRRLGVGKVDEFVGKLLDVGAGHGILYGFSGVTEAARARAENARHPTVEIRDLKQAVAAAPVAADGEALLQAMSFAPSAARELRFGRCDNDNCYQWEVGLSEWDGGVFAGYCDSCGTLNAQCVECDDILALDGFGVSECFSCGAKYEVGYSSDAIPDSVTRVEDEEEPAAG